ncbi:hypothetical protein JCM10449v2_001341 [Rhodotorula kratochvilovae]
MAPYARSLTLVALSLLSLKVAASPSLSPAAADTLFDVEEDGLFEYTASDDFLDELPAPEPADYELVSEEERDALFERSVDGKVAKAWHAHSAQKRALGKMWSGKSTFAAAGSTGVGAMQITLVDDDHILIYDKAENDALKDSRGNSAWASLYSIKQKKVRALNVKTNSFCAGGGWIGNGTLVSVGGNPQQTYINDAAEDGLAAIRLFTPCTNDKCDVYENPARIRLTSQRWYPSTVRLTDGSILIAGGMIAGGYNNQESTDNPTFEFYPPKGTGMPIYSSFLHDALNSNLFPVMWALPNGYLFIAANQIAMLYDWEKNIERRVKSFPNGVTITYPGSSASVLLPLTIANNYEPEVLFCGGTTANLDINPAQLSAKAPASKQCSRMVLNAAGIRKGWQTENMPTARVMGDAILMLDGTILIVNGAATGVAGYGNVKDEVGASNARSPTKQPVLYDPLAAKGKRFSRDFPSASYERLYHSVATLIPDGRIFIAGSNPNDGVSTKTYRTRYNVEMLSPPYTSMTRPTFSGAPANLLYKKSYTLTVNVPSGTKKVQGFIMDLGYSTHGVHMSQRMVELSCKLSGKKLTITGPKTTGIYPPGPAWIHILADGVPSKSTKIMVGPGSSPPVSQSAINNMLKNTKGSN